jgi:hypothetical protein
MQPCEIIEDSADVTAPYERRLIGHAFLLQDIRLLQVIPRISDSVYRPLALERVYTDVRQSVPLPVLLLCGRLRHVPVPPLRDALAFYPRLISY